MDGEAAVNAFQAVRRVIQALGPPLLYRKLNGVLNAIEMQIEVGEYRTEAIVHLRDALTETAIFYGVSRAVLSQLAEEIESFMAKLRPDQP